MNASGEGGGGVGGSTATTAAAHSTVAAKITHVKPAHDGTLGSATATAGSSIMTGGTIKVAGGVQVQTSLSGTPIALNTGQATTAASIRAIGAGGQSTQVRVVMPMIKQLESGRTQITAIPAAPARNVSNASITVTRPVTQATYLPRAGVTATQMSGVGAVGMTGAQRLVTPLRTTSSTASLTPASAGNFVRSTAVNRSVAVSQPSTVISSANSGATWVQGATGVQLIRTIHQPRQRIITTQGLSTTGSGPLGAGSVVSTAGSIMATSLASVQTPGGATALSVTTGQALSHGQQQQQQTPGGAPQAYVATVIPPRQHQATLVYSSNVTGAPNTNPQATGPQQFNPSVAGAQRFAVATPATTTPGGTTVTPRQVRSIPLGKSFPTAKLNTTSISIRAPSIPQLSASLTSGSATAPPTPVSVSAVTAGTSVTGRSGATAVSVAPVLATTNLPTTRIIQLQQPTTGAAQQIIGSTARLAGNVMLQPFIMSSSAVAKMGIRPPVTMTAKVQPSLTITQLNPIGKLAAGGAGTATPGLNTQTVASLQALGAGSTATLGASSVTAGGGATVTSSGAQLVSVSQGGSGAQLLSAGNIVTAGVGGGGGVGAGGSAAAGGATMLPVAISARGAPGSNILTGTLTPIKTAGGITVGKMMMTQSTSNSDVSSSGGVVTTGSGPMQTGGPTSVFIQQHPGSGNVPGTPGATTVATVATSSAASAFLPPGRATIYYESMPGPNTVQVSTGVLSLTTTTVTQSTHSQAQLVSNAGSLSVSSLPFATHAGAGGGSSATTFTVVPSGAGARTLGQIQLPSSARELAGSTLVQTAPGQQQLIIPTGNAGPAGAGSNASAPQHMVIPLHTSVKVTTGGGSQPLQSTTVGGATVSAVSVPGTAAGSLVSSFMRKRDADGSPIRAAKNLGPTFISMAGANSNAPTTVGSSSSTTVTTVNLHSSGTMGTAYGLQQHAAPTAATILPANTSVLTVEALAKKDRNLHVTQQTPMGPTIISSGTRNLRSDSPDSSDGSTTVSANSSPGVDQMQEANLPPSLGGGGGSRIGEAPSLVVAGRETSTHFNPINELYAGHHSMQSNIVQVPIASTRPGIAFDQQQSHNMSQQQHQQQSQPHQPVAQMQQASGIGGGVRMNGGSTYECSARKKPRRSTNDSQHSTQSQSSLSLPPPTGSGPSTGSTTATINNATDALMHNINNNNNGLLLAAASALPPLAQPPPSSSSASSVNSGEHRLGGTAIAPPIVGNKENANPVDFVLRRPRNCALFNTFKTTNKLANNHFHRYSDIKPREERRPTVNDLANQPNVQHKINGWKIFHLRSQMEDLHESEAVSLMRLETMLKALEKDKEKNSDVERVSELLKGNIQRNKIITDGIIDAQNQIMRIFDHKPHVSDIINRCASKRNFKKREKM